MSDDTHEQKFGARRGARSQVAAMALAVALIAPAANAQQAGVPAELPAAGSFSGAVLAARTAERDADYDVAVRYLREALSLAGEEGLDLEQSLLRSLIFAGRFDEAVEIAERLEEGEQVSDDPQSTILLTLVTDALRSREYNRAVQLLDVEGVNDLDNLVISALLAWAHTGLGDREGAMAALAEVDAEGRPEWVRFYARYTKAMIEEHLGNLSAAREAYTRAIASEALGGQLRETYARAVAGLASLEARSGDLEAARAALDTGERVLVADPMIQFVRERLESGATVPRHVTSVADGGSEVLYGLGMALAGSRAGDLARNYLQFSRALAPDAGAPLVGLAQLEELSDRAEKAIAFYEEVPADSPLTDVARLQRGLNLADLERLDEAKTVLREVLEERPEDIRVVLALGNTLALAEDWRDAATLYDTAIARIDEPQRNDWVLFYRRAIARERLKEWPQAETDFLKALDLRPDHPPVLNYLGYSWIDMNMNLDQGLEMIRTAVRLQPNSGAYVDSLGWAFYRLGRFDEAVTELERALSLETSDPVIHDHLGDAYWRVGREREARYQWGHALRMDLEPEDRKRIRRKLSDGLKPLQAGERPGDAEGEAGPKDAEGAGATTDRPDDKA